MNQIANLFQSLSLRQKLSVGLALLTLGAGLSWFVWLRREGELRPLYTGMAPQDADAIARKVKELGIESRLDQSSTAVLVPSGRLDEARLTLAREGLPKSGRMGFEIFDRTQFGTTDFTEHVNYRRALEGELERTIMSLSEVEHARVHITFPKDSVFLDSRQPAKASVLVNVRGSSGLASGSATAITHLVASAVEGLNPDAVSVVDRQGRLLSRPRFNAVEEAGPSDAVLDYRERIEKVMLAKLNQALEPVLGPARFRAGVSVDSELSTVEESEETLDPNTPVTLTSQKTEESNEGATQGGIPGTASNLPRPAARSTAPVGITRRTENATFQTSRKVRHMRQPKGEIRRISVAVLVDQNIRWEQSGKQTERNSEPPLSERLSAIKDIASAVVGLDPDRGDQITVEALPFGANLYEEPPSPAQKPATATGSQNSGWNPRSLKQPEVTRYLVGGVSLAGFIVLMLLLVRRNRPNKVNVEKQRELPAESGATASTRQIANSEAHRKLEEQTRKALEAVMGSGDAVANVITAPRRTGEKDPSAAASVLRSWIVEKK